MPIANCALVAGNGGIVSISSNSWANALAGADTLAVIVPYTCGGWTGTESVVWRVYKCYMAFDTSAIPEGSTINSAYISATLTRELANAGQDMVPITVGIYDWTKTEDPPQALATSDFSLVGVTQFASAVSDNENGKAVQFTLNASGLANIVAASYTYFAVLAGGVITGVVPPYPTNNSADETSVLTVMELVVTYTEVAPTPSTLVTPADDGVAPYPSAPFTWTPVAGAASYTIEVTHSTDTEFADPVFSHSIADITDTVTGLAANSNYIWRVTVDNTGAVSSVFGFATAGGPNEVDFVSETRIPENFTSEAMNPAFESSSLSNFASTELKLNFETTDATTQ